MTDGVILVFARAPEAGQAKTRLIPKLGPEGAAQLHSRLVHLTLETATAFHNVSVQLWCSPDPHRSFFSQCRATYDVTLHAQSGVDLGERMLNAFNQALTDYDWALLIGTDCPDLNIEDFEQAEQDLNNGIDVVLGPAADGGYYLIGLKRPEPNLFQNIPWGGSEVLSCTYTRLNEAGLTFSQLHEHHDIDRPEDLIRFLRLSDADVT
ncbi:MAG: glycosyltransferase [Proteobacteria bacterium]|nr:glycosyltransferase [Pseudomonadota bacterium]